MLDSIRTLADLPTRASAVVSQADRVAARERRLLMEEARQRATAIVTEASDQADEIRASALQEGFTHGVLQAASEIGQALLLEKGLAARLRQDACDTVRTLLTEVSGRDEWIDGLLTRWLVELDANQSVALQVVMPQHCKGAHKAVLERLRGQWHGTVSLEYHADERYLFRLADQVLELNVPAAVAPMSSRLALQLASLKPAMQTLDEASARYLQSWVEGFVAHAQAITEEQDHAN